MKHRKLPPRKVIEERLMKRVTVVPETGCWEYGTRRGYQSLSVGGNKYLATRLSLYCWISLKDWRYACHKCDNPPCINPQHLFPACNWENLEDMIKKGRHASQRIDGKTRCRIVWIMKPHKILDNRDGKPQRDLIRLAAKKVPHKPILSNFSL